IRFTGDVKLETVRRDGDAFGLLADRRRESRAATRHVDGGAARDLLVRDENGLPVRANSHLLRVLADGEPPHDMPRAKVHDTDGVVLPESDIDPLSIRAERH